jgi:hypothetical protein
LGNCVEMLAPAAPSAFFPLNDASMSVLLRNVSLELLVFVMLGFLTVFRKELSANDDHRDHGEDEEAEEEQSSKRAAAGEITSSGAGGDGASLRSLAAASFRGSERVRHEYHHPDLRNARRREAAIAADDGAAAAIVANTCARQPLRVLDCLPHEAWMLVFRFVDLPTVLSAASVSRAVSQLVDRPLGEPCVWQDLWTRRFGALWKTRELQSAAALHHAHWHPALSAPSAAAAADSTPAFPQQLAPHQPSSPPPRPFSAVQGGSEHHASWRRLFFDFDFAWLDWCLVGQNKRARADGKGQASVEATECSGEQWQQQQQQRCLVGIHGSVYDISQFLDEHPGSPETLLDNSGGDATEFFESVGHSRVARRMMPPLQIIPALHVLTADSGWGNLGPIGKSDSSSTPSVDGSEIADACSRKKAPIGEEEGLLSQFFDPDGRQINRPRLRLWRSRTALATRAHAFDRAEALSQGREWSWLGTGIPLRAMSMMGFDLPKCLEWTVNSSDASPWNSCGPCSSDDQGDGGWGGVVDEPSAVGSGGCGAFKCTRCGIVRRALRNDVAEELMEEISRDSPPASLPRPEGSNTPQVVPLQSPFLHMHGVCAERNKHCGRCRIFYDPFQRHWACWWTCCHTSVVLS